MTSQAKRKPRRNNRRMNPKAVQLYRDFHGVAPVRVRVMNLPPPPSDLVVLGEIVEITYKPYGQSQLKGAAYRHLFGDRGTARMGKERPSLAVTVDGKQLYFLNEKSNYVFGPRGIVG